MERILLFGGVALHVILNDEYFIGAGTVVVKNILDSGVYVGTPSKRIKKSTGKLSGIPTWRKK